MAFGIHLRLVLSFLVCVKFVLKGPLFKYRIAELNQNKELKTEYSQIAATETKPFYHYSLFSMVPQCVAFSGSGIYFDVFPSFTQ